MPKKKRNVIGQKHTSKDGTNYTFMGPSKGWVIDAPAAPVIEYSPTGLPGVKATADPSKPGEVLNVQKATAPAPPPAPPPLQKTLKVPDPSRKGEFLDLTPAEAKTLATTTKPLDNVVKHTLVDGKVINLKLDTPQKITAYNELLFRTANRDSLAIDAKMKATVKELDSVEAEMLEIEEKLSAVEPDEITPVIKTEVVRKALEARLNKKARRIQVLAGTEGLGVEEGVGAPGSRGRAYKANTKDDYDTIPVGEWYQNYTSLGAKSGEIKQKKGNELAGGQTAAQIIAADPTVVKAKVTEDKPAEVKTAGGVPGKAKVSDLSKAPRPPEAHAESSTTGGKATTNAKVLARKETELAALIKQIERTGEFKSLVARRSKLEKQIATLKKLREKTK